VNGIFVLESWREVTGEIVYIDRTLKTPGHWARALG
jgi:hypothetical protein